MRSAVFVDFDNVFSQLRQLHPEAAERFARHPSEWIGWLTKSLPLPATRRESVAEDAQPSHTEASSAGSGVVATLPEPAAKLTPRAATSEELSEIVRRIWKSVEEAAPPLPASSLASQLRSEYPEALANCSGTGSFKAFSRALGLSRLQWLSVSGGRLMDPSPHQLESRLWHALDLRLLASFEYCTPHLAPGKESCLMGSGRRWPSGG